MQLLGFSHPFDYQDSSSRPVCIPWPPYVVTALCMSSASGGSRAVSQLFINTWCSSLHDHSATNPCSPAMSCSKYSLPITAPIPSLWSSQRKQGAPKRRLCSFSVHPRSNHSFWKFFAASSICNKLCGSQSRFVKHVVCQGSNRRLGKAINCVETLGFSKPGYEFANELMLDVLQ